MANSSELSVEIGLNAHIGHVNALDGAKRPIPKLNDISDHCQHY
jgi:hypothetical protein